MCTYYHRLILSNFNLFFFLWEWLHECLSKWNKPWYNCRWIISVVMVIIFDTTLTWNVRSMNQGKLEVVKQEMARVNADILGISKLKWTGMDDFNSDDHYIYYCRQDSLKKWSSHHSQQKSLKCSTWMHSQKWQNDLCSFPRQTIQYHSNPSLCLNQ